MGDEQLGDDRRPAPHNFVNYTDERYRRKVGRTRGARRSFGKFTRFRGQWTSRKRGMHYGDSVLLVSGLPFPMNTILYVVGWSIVLAVAFWLEGLTLADRAMVFVIGLLGVIISQLHGISKKLDKRAP